MPAHLPIIPAQSARGAGGQPRRFPGQKYLGFRCTQCGNCCTRTIVPITTGDLARLVAGTGLRAERIVAFYASDDFSCGGEDLTYAQLDVGPRVMGLRRRAQGEDMICRFYGDGACTVYAERPVTCRLWPFKPTLGPRGRITRLALDKAVPCPYELDGEVDQRALVEHWRLSLRDDASWRRQVAAWNRRHAGGTRRQFLAFLGYP